jgi:hypothetical protein
MSTRRYNVLWFDDQFDQLPVIDESANENGIDLIGCKSAEEGLAMLDANVNDYDAILVDGNFYTKKTHAGDNVSDMAFGEVAKWLSQNEHKKKIPWFVLSGQQNFTATPHPYTKLYDKKVYEKQKVNLLPELWQEIKTAADEQIDTQIKHRHAKVFEACNFLNPEGEIKAILLEILKSTDLPGAIDDGLYYNQLRIAVEKLFRSANKYGLLHDKCIPNGRVNLNASSLFLAGKEVKLLQVKCSVAHFPSIIADHVQQILDVTNAASHTDDADKEDRNTLTYYKQIIQTPYLLYSMTFALMDVLIWFNEYLALNQDVDKNRSLWLPIGGETSASLEDEYIGTVQKLPANAFAFFKSNDGKISSFITPGMVTEKQLIGNEKVRVTIKDVPKGTQVETLTIFN